MIELEPIEDVDPIVAELAQIDRREHNAWRRHYKCNGDNLCQVCAAHWSEKLIHED